MKIFVTAGIAEEMKVPDFGQFVAESLRRHLGGEWDDVFEEERESNDNGRGNALSAYHAPSVRKIWVSQTVDIVTVLFPEEY